MKEDKLLTFVEFILDNVFDIATILVAAFLVIQNEFQPFTNEELPTLITWLLAVLGLLAVSGVWERSRRIKKIEIDLRKLNETISKRFDGRIGPSEFFLPAKSFPDDFFSSANSILLVGITLNRTTRRFMHVLCQRLLAGCHIRFVLIDPTLDAVMETMSRRSMGDTTPQFWRSRMATVEEVISVIQNTPNSIGTVEVGYLPYIPSFGLSMIDSNEARGLTFVEIYHHRTAEENPMFQVSAGDDPIWWSFFKNQAEIMWNDCRKKE